MLKPYYFIIKACLCLLFFGAAQAGISQNGCFEIDWSYNYGGSGRDWGNTLELTPDGGYIMAGYSRSNDVDVSGNNGDWDFWVVKLDEEGLLQWERNFGGSADDQATSVQVTADGGYIVAGSTYSTDGNVSFNHGEEDFWVLKLDAAGNLQWERSYGGSSIDRAESVIETSDGGYILAGFSDSSNGDVGSNNGNFDYWVVKTDASGNLQWEQNYGGSGPDWAYEIEESSDGGYVLTGSSISDDGDVGGNNGFYDYWVVKIDDLGTIIWERNFGGDGEDRSYYVHETVDGGYIVSGSSYSSNGDITNPLGSSDFWTIKLDAAGNLLWQYNSGGAFSEWAWSIDLTDDGGYILCGRANSAEGMVTGNNGSRDFWMVKLNASGLVEWTNNFGGSLRDVPYSVHQTADGGYVIGGYSESNDGDVPDNNGDWDYWVLKIIPREIEVDLGKDTTLCEGEGLLLSDTYPAADYEWQDGSTDSTYTVSFAGLYWMELSVDDCVIRDSIEITYVGADVLDLGPDTAFCAYEPYLLDVSSTEAESYRWQDNSTDAVFLVRESGKYTVEIEIEGCQYKDSILISFNNPIVDLGEDTVICEEDIIVLRAFQEDASYLWQDGSFEDRFLAQDTGTYSVIVDINGCQTADTIHISWCEKFRDPCFEVPNAFSNNGDGINDVWRPVPFCRLDGYRLLVFNRWGQVIFTTNDPEQAWDGFYKGKRLMEGVYAYLIEYEYTLDGERYQEMKKGVVMMLR